MVDLLEVRVQKGSLNPLYPKLPVMVGLELQEAIRLTLTPVLALLALTFL